MTIVQTKILIRIAGEGSWSEEFKKISISYIPILQVKFGSIIFVGTFILYLYKTCCKISIVVFVKVVET